MDERARFRVTCCVDVQVAPASRDAAAREQGVPCIIAGNSTQNLERYIRASGGVAAPFPTWPRYPQDAGTEPVDSSPVLSLHRASTTREST